jgi:hypothetical protein
MFRFLYRWLGHRQAIRRRWQSDAKLLAGRDPVRAYYESQRRVFHSRSEGDFHEYWHWAKVASEVARIEPRVEMDFDILKVLSDQEEPGRR